MALIILGILAGLLFALAFFTKRRFGLLAFALCAGVVLAEALDQDAALIVEAAGTNVPFFDSDALAYVLITLLPPFALLIGGIKYHDSRLALLSGVGFAVLGVLLIIEKFYTHLPLDGTSEQVLQIMLKYKTIAITALILVGLFDILSLKNPKLGKKH
jgi:hypothetical protein